MDCVFNLNIDDDDMVEDCSLIPRNKNIHHLWYEHINGTTDAKKKRQKQNQFINYQLSIKIRGQIQGDENLFYF